MCSYIQSGLFSEDGFLSGFSFSLHLFMVVLRLMGFFPQAWVSMENKTELNKLSIFLNFFPVHSLAVFILPGLNIFEHFAYVCHELIVKFSIHMLVD